MKRIFSVILATLIAVSLSACAGSGTTDTLADKADTILTDEESKPYDYTVEMKGNVNMIFYLKSDMTVSYVDYTDNNTKTVLSEVNFSDINLNTAISTVLKESKPKKGEIYTFNITKIANGKDGKEVKNTIETICESNFHDSDYSYEVKLKVPAASSTVSESALLGAE